MDTNNNRLFVVDRLNSRVLVFNLDPTTHLPLDYTADYVLGQANFTSSVQAVTQSGMYYPIDVAYDHNNDFLFVSHRADDGITISGRVLVYDLSGGITNGMNATYVIGQPDFTTVLDGFPLTQTTTPFATGLDYDEVNDKLFVFDDYGGTPLSARVLVFNLAGGITNGMPASNVIGAPDFTTSVSETTQDGFSGGSSNDVLFEPNSNYLFVTDKLNRRIMVFDLSSGITNGMNASYVLGQADFTTGSDQGVTASSLSNIALYLSYDSTNSLLFVSDSINYRVLVFNLTSGITNNMSASYVLGQSNFTGNTAQSTPSRTNLLPGGVHYDVTNKLLYIANVYRTLVFDLTATVSRGKTYFPPPTCTITSSPATIAPNSSSTLSWSTTPTDAPYYFRLNDGEIIPSTTTSQTVTPAQTTDYTLSVINLFGANTCTTTVTVAEPTPPTCEELGNCPPPPTCEELGNCPPPTYSPLSCTLSASSHNS